MKIQFQSPFRTALVTLALAIACSGCFLIPPKHSDYRAIHEYSTDGNVAGITQDLATYPGDVNLTDDAGRTPLHLAATHCHVDAAKVLLDNGAKIDAKAAGGTTPLDLAAQAGCVDMVNLLLSKGANVNARDDQGRTPLDRAMQWHRDEVVQILQAHGGIK
jgi:ankyrin repeat protein